MIGVPDSLARPPRVSVSRPMLLCFFFITLKPRVEYYAKSMSLKYEPASEPLHISVQLLYQHLMTISGFAFTVSGLYLPLHPPRSLTLGGGVL